MKNSEFMFNDPAVRNALRELQMADNGYNSVDMSVLPDPMVLAMSYMPMQIFKDMYDVHEGFNRGTIFPELDKPFTAGDCK